MLSTLIHFLGLYGGIVYIENWLLTLHMMAILQVGNPTVEGALPMSARVCLARVV